MSKTSKSMYAEGGHIKRDIIIPALLDGISEIEESKLDPGTLSGDCSHAVTEGGLILCLLPPSATHTKNT